jgi:hypothetical protein
MANGTKDGEIREVMAEEKSRGRRPLDSKARKERADLLRHVKEALDLDSEAEFIKAIRGLRIAEDPQKLEDAVKLWRSFSFLRRK